MTTDDLDILLAGAARKQPAPSAELIDRVLADAYALQPQPKPQTLATPVALAQPGLLARLAALFGGGPVLAGVCSAALAGVALGYFSPTAYEYLTGSIAGGTAEAVDLFPTTDFLNSEG